MIGGKKQKQKLPSLLLGFEGPSSFGPPACRSKLSRTRGRGVWRLGVARRDDGGESLRGCVNERATRGPPSSQNTLDVPASLPSADSPSHARADFRYMATSDLLAELTKETFRAAPDVEKKVCAVVLKQLDDQAWRGATLSLSLPTPSKEYAQHSSRTLVKVSVEILFPRSPPP